MAHEGLWEQVEGLEPEETAKRAKCFYIRERGRYELRLLEKDYVVEIKGREIFSADSEGGKGRAGFLEQLCLLAYLINAKDLPIANKLVNAEELPGGQFFFRGPHKLAVEKLVKAFGRCPEDLYRVMERLGAKRCEFGDASIELYVLPKIPLTMILWGECEEFDARASILFDQTAASQLPLDALLTATNLAVDTMIEAFISSD